METVKRNYKDSLFRDIFKDEKRLAEIYAGMFDEPVAAIDIELAALDWTFFTGIRNDVSFLVRQQYIVLLEHQSTLNANMPLRMLDYIAQLYRQYIDADAIYRERLIAFPAPRLHVLYNGEAEMPSRWEMRLFDAFASQKGDMEVVVHVWNINDSSKHGILRKCRALKACSVFVGQVRNMVRHVCDMESSVRQAIQYCIDHDWLREYFKQKQEGRSTSANRASPSVRVLGTFSHTTYYPIICALGACFLDRSAGGLRYGKLRMESGSSFADSR